MGRSGSDDNVHTALLVNDVPAAPPSSIYSFYVLAVLTMIYFSNQVDRLILPFIKTNMQEDVHFTSSEYGLLFGYGFSIVFVAVGLLIGPLADKVNRTYLLLGGLLLWSSMTFATAYASKFWHLLVTRIGLGIGQAACNPPAFSILSDYFPPERRAVANSVYTMGIYFGGGAASVLGGTLSESDFGWRNTLRMFGYLGFALVALGFFTLREPVRGRFKAKAADGNEGSAARTFTAMETIRYLMALGTPWKFFVAAGVRTMGGYSFGGFVPSYMKQSFPDDISRLLVLYGIVTLVFGAAASFGGGAISKRWQKKNKKAPAYIGAIGAVVSLPFVMMIMFATKMTDNTSAAFAIAITGLAFEYLTAEVWGGPASAVVANLLPSGMQGTGFSVYFSISTLVGAGGPEILGLILQHYSKGAGITDTKTYITATMIVATYTISAFGLVTSMVSFEKDLKIKEHVEETGEIPSIPQARKTAFYIGIGVIIAITITLVVLSLAIKN